MYVTDADLPVPDWRIELIVTASVGLVWAGQHLAHNAQRQNAPAHSTHYFTATIEGIFFSCVPIPIPYPNYTLTYLPDPA